MDLKLIAPLKRLNSLALHLQNFLQFFARQIVATANIARLAE